MEDQVIALLQSEDPGVEKLFKVREEACSYADTRKVIIKAIENFKTTIGKGLATENKAEVRKGVLHWIVGNAEQAAAIFESARTGVDREFFLGICYLDMDKNSMAVEHLKAAYEGDRDSELILSYYIEAQIRNGDFEDAQNSIEKLAKTNGESAEVHYLNALLADMKGYRKEAEDNYNKALKVDPDHQKSIFRLAYYYDIHGEDDTARELYEQLKAINPCHINTLLNLGIIYEDQNEYQKAIECYKTILESYPTNWRVRMYMKDAMASLKMFYDEEVLLQQERERKLASQYIVELALPKRIKTALAKSGVNTLADLVKRTEEELEELAGLGQNGIRDIKELLNSKGLSLQSKSESSLEEYLATIDPKVLEKPLSELEWSGRNKKLFDKLGTITVGDLVRYTEEELTKHKNVGATSIKEIKQRLAELNIELRKK